MTQEDSKNTNTLVGFRCPECGAEDEFKIHASSMFQVVDLGTGDLEDVDWEDSSYCRCVVCDHDGIVMDFQIKNQPIPPTTPVAFKGYDEPSTLRVIEKFIDYLITSEQVDEHDIYSLRSDVRTVSDVCRQENFNHERISLRLANSGYRISSKLFDAFKLLKHFRYIVRRSERAAAVDIKPDGSFEVTLTAKAQVELSATIKVLAKNEVEANKLARSQIDNDYDWSVGDYTDISNVTSSVVLKD